MAIGLISGALRRQGQKLLHQQCWNWGRDIVRSEGNLLLEAGFVKQRPPDGESGSTRYTLALAGGGSLMLWGFGLYYGTAQQGGVYLSRYQFQPQWLPWAAAERPIWKPDMIPVAQTPPSPRIPVELTIAAARRIADYEEWALALCGLEYRCGVLRQWKQAAKALPPQGLPPAWRALAAAMDGRLHPQPLETSK